MSRAVLLAAIVAAAGPAAFRQPDSSERLIARAREVVQRLVSGDVEPLLPELTEKMKGAIDADGLRRLIPSRTAQLGAFRSQTGARLETQGVMRVVLVACAGERANVDIRVAFNPAGQIGGLGIAPPGSTASYAAPPYVAASAFRDAAVTIDAGGWPLPGTLSMPWAMSSASLRVAPCRE